MEFSIYNSMVCDNLDEIIRNQLDKTLSKTNFTFIGKLYQGKVRDNYIQDDTRIIIATDRLSAFDRVITCLLYTSPSPRDRS